MQKEVDKLEKKQVQLEKEFLSLCNSRYDGGEKYAYLPGTCGELPVHSCLLLGITDLARKLVDQMHSPDKNALVSAQATGAFFKSSELTFAKRESVGSVFGHRVAVARSRARRCQFHNPDAACNYGEFAMSFASSL